MASVVGILASTAAAQDDLYNNYCQKKLLHPDRAFVCFHSNDESIGAAFVKGGLVEYGFGQDPRSK